MDTVLEAERPADYLSRLAASQLGRAYKSLVIDELRIEPGATVVDLGCGPGADLGAFAAAVGPGGRVVGIDSDARAIAEAMARFSGHVEVDVRVGDAHELDLADQSIDRIHTDRVLQHVARPETVVDEAARVLRPGGVATFAEPDWDTLVIDYPEPEIPAAYRRFITDRVVRNARVGRMLPALCERSGLDVARVVPITAIFRDLAQADRLFGFHRVTEGAVRDGYLSATAGGTWLDRLQTERFFLSVSLFVTVATRPGD